MEHSPETLRKIDEEKRRQSTSSSVTKTDPVSTVSSGPHPNKLNDNNTKPTPTEKSPLLPTSEEMYQQQKEQPVSSTVNSWNSDIESFQLISFSDQPTMSSIKKAVKINTEKDVKQLLRIINNPDLTEKDVQIIEDGDQLLAVYHFTVPNALNTFKKMVKPEDPELPTNTFSTLAYSLEQLVEEPLKLLEFFKGFSFQFDATGPGWFVVVPIGSGIKLLDLLNQFATDKALKKQKNGQALTRFEHFNVKAHPYFRYVEEFTKALSESALFYTVARFACYAIGDNAFQSTPAKVIIPTGALLLGFSRHALLRLNDKVPERSNLVSKAAGGVLRYATLGGLIELLKSTGDMAEDAFAAYIVYGLSSVLGVLQGIFQHLQQTGKNIDVRQKAKLMVEIIEYLFIAAQKLTTSALCTLLLLIFLYENLFNSDDMPHMLRVLVQYTVLGAFTAFFIAGVFVNTVEEKQAEYIALSDTDSSIESHDDLGSSVVIDQNSVEPLIKPEIKDGDYEKMVEQEQSDAEEDDALNNEKLKPNNWQQEDLEFSVEGDSVNSIVFAAKSFSKAINPNSKKIDVEQDIIDWTNDKSFGID